MGHADRRAGQEEVGGAGLPRDEATGDTDGGLEIGAVGLDAGG